MSNNQSFSSSMAEVGERMKDMFTWMLLTIFLFWLIFPPIVLLVKWIQYLIELKKAGNAYNNENLQKAYKFQIVSILVTVALVIIVFALSFSVFGNIMDNIDTIDPYDPGALQDLIGAELSTVTIVSGILGLISSVLNLLAYLAFNEWGDSYCASQSGAGACKDITGGLNNLKIASIISLVSGATSFLPIGFLGGVLSLIGFIFQLIGLKDAGEGLQQEFKYGTPQPTVGGGQADQSYYGAPSTPQTQEISESKPIGDTSGVVFCPNCGAKTTGGEKFCRACGSKLPANI